MQKIEILVLLKMIGQNIGFDEIQDNSELRSYEGKVLSTIIEHDGNHKLCVEVEQDNCEIFDVNRLKNLRNFDIRSTPLKALLCKAYVRFRKYTKRARKKTDFSYRNLRTSTLSRDVRSIGRHTRQNGSILIFFV